MEDFELFGNLYSPLIILFLIPRATSTSSPYLRTYLLRSFIRCPLLLRLCFICLFQPICIVHRLIVRLFAFFSLLLFSISILPLFPHSYGTAAITYLAGRSIFDATDIASPDHLICDSSASLQLAVTMNPPVAERYSDMSTSSVPHPATNIPPRRSSYSQSTAYLPTNLWFGNSPTYSQILSSSIGASTDGTDPEIMKVSAMWLFCYPYDVADGVLSATFGLHITHFPHERYATPPRKRSLFYRSSCP